MLVLIGAKRVFDTGPSLAMCGSKMKTTRHLRKLDQSFWLRNTRDLLSSGIQKRFIVLILALLARMERLPYRQELDTGR